MRIITRLLGWVLAVYMAALGIQTIINGTPIFEALRDGVTAEWNADAPWIEPWGRYGVAALQLIAAVLLTMGRRWTGGGLSIGLTLGAIIAQVAVIGTELPMTADPSAPATPFLFYLSIFGLGLSALVTFLSRPL
jgi:hypothetical protein